MACKRNRFSLPIHLIEALEIISDDFEVAAAELLRIGAMDALKMLPLGKMTGQRGVYEISLPESLQQRISTHSKQVSCPLDTMIENILWAMVHGFPDHINSSMRENAAGLERLKKHLAISGWW